MNKTTGLTAGVTIELSEQIRNNKETRERLIKLLKTIDLELGKNKGNEFV